MKLKIVVPMHKTSAFVGSGIGHWLAALPSIFLEARFQTRPHDTLLEWRALLNYFSICCLNFKLQIKIISIFHNINYSIPPMLYPRFFKTLLALYISYHIVCVSHIRIDASHLEEDRKSVKEEKS